MWLVGAIFLWVAVGLAMRLPLLPEESGDFRNYVGPWLHTLETDGFSAFATPFADYTPAYLYGLWLLTFLPLPGLLATKFFSIAFDLVLAGCLALLGRRYGLSQRSAATLFGAVFLLPTVLLNSASWAQCDAIYASAVVVGLLFLARGWTLPAILAVGVGIAFKAQAAFVLPFLLVLTLRGEVRWRDWLVLPLPYLLIALPAVFAGRPLVDLLTIYFSQAEKYSQLTLNAPTVYAWLPLGQSWGTLGIFAGGLIVLVATLLAAKWARLSTPADRLALVTFVLVLVPFVLPRMHDRYFFLADATATLYAFLRPSRWFVAVLIVSASTASYLPFLYSVEPVPLGVSAAAMALALAVLASDVFPLAALVSQVAQRLAPRRRVRVAFQFALVGVASTAAFLVLYALLRRSLEPTSANAIALFSTMLLNFAANRYSSFRDRRSSVRGELPSYLAIYLSGLAASMLAFEVALAAAGAPSPSVELLLALASGGIGTVLRFVLLTRFVYREPHRPRVRSAPRAPAGDSTRPEVAPGSGDAYP